MRAAVTARPPHVEKAPPVSARLSTSLSEKSMITGTDALPARRSRMMRALPLSAAQPTAAIGLLMGAIVAGTAPVKAESATAPLHVVELYTSQGCSACPPADKLLATYVERPDVLALTLPVDIWDYLGWRDTFAKRAYSERQRLYARKRGDGQVYTPQVVVNGTKHAIGHHKDAIDAAIKRTIDTLAERRLRPVITRDGNLVSVDARAHDGSDASGEARVWLAQIRDQSTVKIRRGENGGRRLSYHNVVERMMPVGTWRGTALRVALPEEPEAQDRTFALIFQDGLAGPILGAARVPDTD